MDFEMPPGTKSKTRRLAHPSGEAAALRVNILAVLFNSDGHVFIGDNTLRDNDLRRYTASMVEGGVDVGETAATALLREIQQETGFKKPTFLAGVEKPLICYFEDWQKPDQQYSGKILFVHALGIFDPNDKMDLSGKMDEEGRTFKSGKFMPLTKAKKHLLKNTTSQLRRAYIEETFSLIQPLAETIAAVNTNGKKIDSTSIRRALLAADKAKPFTNHVVEPPDTLDGLSCPLPAATPNRDRIKAGARPKADQNILG